MAVENALSCFQQLSNSIFTEEDMLVLEESNVESLNEEEKSKKLRFRCPMAICSAGFVSIVSFRDHVVDEHNRLDFKAYEHPWVEQKANTCSPIAPDQPLSLSISNGSFHEDIQAESLNTNNRCSSRNSLTCCCSKKLNPGDLFQNLPSKFKPKEASTLKYLDEFSHVDLGESISTAVSFLPASTGAEALCSTLNAEENTDLPPKPKPASCACSICSCPLDSVGDTCDDPESDSVSLSPSSAEPLLSLPMNHSVGSVATETGKFSEESGTHTNECSNQDPIKETGEDQDFTENPTKRDSLDVESGVSSMTSSISSAASSDFGIYANTSLADGTTSKQTASPNSTNNTINSVKKLTINQGTSDSGSPSPATENMLLLDSESSASSSVTVTSNNETHSANGFTDSKETHVTTSSQNQPASAATQPAISSLISAQTRSGNDACESSACPNTKQIPEEDMQFMLQYMGHYMKLFSDDETLRLWNDRKGKGLNQMEIAKVFCNNPHLLKEMSVWFFQDPEADYGKMKPLFDKLGSFEERACRLVQRASSHGFYLGMLALDMHKYRQEVSKELEVISERDNEALFFLAYVLLNGASKTLHVGDGSPLIYFTMMCIAKPGQSSFADRYPRVTESLADRSSGTPSDKFFGLVRILEVAMRRLLDVRNFESTFLRVADMLTEEMHQDRTLRKYVIKEMNIGSEQARLLELFISQFLDLRWACQNIFDFQNPNIQAVKTSLDLLSPQLSH